MGGALGVSVAIDVNNVWNSNISFDTTLSKEQWVGSQRLVTENKVHGFIYYFKVKVSWSYIGYMGATWV